MEDRGCLARRLPLPAAVAGLLILVSLGGPATAQQPDRSPEPVPLPSPVLPDRDTPQAAGPAVPALPAPLERSPGNADYRIVAELDSGSRVLVGRQVLTWTNIQSVAAEELRFHLYWNGWRNDRSTWMREARWRGRVPRDVRPEDYAWQDVEAVRLLAHSGEVGPQVAGSDLADGARFESPDDGNPHDRTVLVVPLPAPVAPGETVQVEMEWRARVPRTFARTGFRGDYYFIAHWFPKLGVFEGADGWSCHQYHAATEYHSDYGHYEVTLTLPASFVVGATGRLQGEPTVDGTGGDARQTLTFVQDDVHGFAWTASPDFREATRTFEHPSLPPVEMRLLYQPEHEHQVDRHFAATAAALEHYGLWYGPYPYGHVTVVDPAWESGSGGMEYPTLFTCGTRLFNPAGGGSPEGVTIHEAGHQFWYGLVGNDEFDHAWIDEGLNTFSTARTYAEEYGERARVERYLAPPGTSWRGFLARRVPQITESREGGGNRLSRYRRDARADVPATPTWRYFPGSASSISYSKTALWLHTLERHLGWEPLREILSTFFTHYRYRHPEPADFFAVAHRVARQHTGEDLEWFFDQVHRDNAVFDYAVAEVRSRPVTVTGWVTEGGERTLRDGSRGQGEDPVFRTEVVVERRQDGVFPVDVLLVFEDGSEIRRHWHGRDAWKMFLHEGPSRLAHAEVDPGRVLLLDVDRTNNSRRLEPPAPKAAVQWAAKWLVWFQDYLQTFTFFI